MDLYNAVRQSFSDDEGVSPVIAVILMVAITVVLAATVYVWVSGFASDDTGPEQASATARGADLDDNGDTEWVRITLTKGENAPYDENDTTVSVTASDGSSITALCETAQGSAPDTCTDDFDSTATVTETWDVGETLWVPCSGSGNHVLSASVRGSTILDTTVSCGEAA